MVLMSACFAEVVGVEESAEDEELEELEVFEELEDDLEEETEDVIEDDELLEDMEEELSSMALTGTQTPEQSAPPVDTSQSSLRSSVHV
jgi:rubrerythrin